jgi:hypothetical protein
MTENLDVISARTGPPQTPAAAPSIVVPVSGLQASVKLLDLAPGLYAVSIQPARSAQVSLGGMTLPATLVTPLGNNPEHGAEIFGAEGGGNWVGPSGGTVVLRIPTGGGRSLITTYRSEQQEAVPLSIQITLISGPASAAAPARKGNGNGNGAAPVSPAPAAEPTLPAEITYCIDQASEQAVAGSWAGTPGSKRFLEAFGITPQGHITPDGIEYKGFGPNGRETPWVSTGKLCGSRGKNVALTGFAIRPAEHLREKIDVVYEGAFAKSGRLGPCRNGEPCRGTRTDDPLEAFSLKIISRA